MEINLPSHSVVAIALLGANDTDVKSPQNNDNYECLLKQIRLSVLFYFKESPETEINLQSNFWGVLDLI